MTTLQGGVSSGWGASSDPVPQTTGTNWGATLAGVVGNAIPYVTDMLTGNASFNSAPQPVQQQPLQGGTQYQQSNYTNPTLPVQQNEVVQGIPQGSVVNTNYAPVQTNLDYTNIVNRAAVQTPNAPDFAQAPGGPTNPQFAVIQPGQNQGMPQATGPTAQPPGTTPIIGADGLIRIGRNTFSPNDVTAQGMAGDYGGQQQSPYSQPQRQYNYRAQPQPMMQPSPYLQQQQQLLQAAGQPMQQSDAYQQALQAQQNILKANAPYVNNQIAYPDAPTTYANQTGWRGKVNRFAGAMNPNLGAQMKLADKHAGEIYKAQYEEAGRQHDRAMDSYGTAANNMMTQEGLNTRAGQTQMEKLADKYLHDPNNPTSKDPLIKYMLDKFPNPGQEREDFMRSVYLDKGVNLQEYRDVVNPMGDLIAQQRANGIERQDQIYDYYGQKNPLSIQGAQINNQLAQQRYDYYAQANAMRLKQLANNNQLSDMRIDLMSRTKEAVVALKTAQSERAQLELGIRKEFGKDMAEAQIAKLRVSRAATENKLIESNVQGAKIVVDEFLKLQGQMATTMDPTIRAQLQSQMGVFGEAKPLGQPISTGKLGTDGKPIMITGSIPSQVHGAIRYLTEVAPAQKKELQDAYKQVEILNKAAKAGGALPPINSDGSLKATAGKLK